jgi:hypothetical protein
MDQVGEDKGQSAVLVAIAMLVLVIFAAITVDISSAYLGRRTAQNAADGAALAAARQLAYQYNTEDFDDSLIKIELNNFGELNGAKDTGGVPGDAINSSVIGAYLDKHENVIAVIGAGSVPAGAQGVEATVYITTPSFFGGVMGESDYPVQAQAAVMLNLACGGSCVVPIATHYYPFTTTVTTTVPCYNIWNGVDPGNFGWLNWSWQGVICEANPLAEETCSAECVAENLDPTRECLSGFISVGDWVAGTVGVKNAETIGSFLETYRITGEPFTVVVWEVTNEKGGCGQDSAGEYVIAQQQGLHYQVAGFAEMQVLGYQLPNGNPVPDPTVFDYTQCTNIAPPEQQKEKQGFRITTKYVGRAEGEGGRCKVTYGSVVAPTLTR